MTKPPYQIDSSLRKNYPAHHPQEGGGGFTPSEFGAQLMSAQNAEEALALLNFPDSVITTGSNANGDYIIILGILGFSIRSVNVNLTQGGNQLFDYPLNYASNPNVTWAHADTKTGTDLSALFNATVDSGIAPALRWRWVCDGSGTTTESNIILGAWGILA